MAESSDNPSGDALTPATREEILRDLSERDEGYGLVLAMKELSQRMAAGDAEATGALQDMLEQCRDPELWLRRSRYCSAVIHAAAHTGTLRSMKMLLKFVEGLPESIPYGAVELISSILPSYKRIILGPITELIEGESGGPARAVGIQTLCNLYLEGPDSMQNEQVQFLKRILKDFDADDYLTQHLADTVRLEMSYKEREAQGELDSMLKGFLVENGRE